MVRLIATVTAEWRDTRSKWASVVISELFVEFIVIRIVMVFFSSIDFNGKCSCHDSTIAQMGTSEIEWEKSWENWICLHKCVIIEEDVSCEWTEYKSATLKFNFSSTSIYIYEVINTKRSLASIYACASTSASVSRPSDQYSIDGICS